MGIPDHLTCLLINLYAGKEATVRIGHEIMDWFKIVQGVRQGCILSPCLFNLYAEYIIWNAGPDDSQAGIRIAGKNINNLRYADDTTFMAEIKEELKSLLMKVKKESEKAGLKLNIQKTKIMASGSITSWQIGGGKVETQISFSWTPESLWTVTATTKLKDTCSLEEKLWQPRQCIRKQRYYFANRGPYSQSYGFPVVMYGCESWAIKMPEHQKIDAFKLWCWRKLLSPLDSKEIKPVNPEGNQLWIFIGRTGAEAEGPVLWPPDADSLEKTLMLKRLRAGEGGNRRWGDWMASSTQCLSLSKLKEIVKDRDAWHVAVHGVAKSQDDLVTEQQHQQYHHVGI